LENKNQFQPETPAESSTKGKNKEAENVVKSLELVVKNNENIVVASSSGSKKNLKELTGEGGEELKKGKLTFKPENKLY
jgi:predicted ABC-type transport system involved in lysophospholipase L1 biosynthesis ATPase subunit